MTAMTTEIVNVYLAIAVDYCLHCFIRIVNNITYDNEKTSNSSDITIKP